MPNTTNTPPILINNPLTLLYWLFFRPLALRRYARSIDEKLDEELKVWEVRQEIEHDARFKALCRARWWLLTTIPICAVLLSGGMSFLFGTEFEWSRSLFFVIGYTGATLLSDVLYWHFPEGSSRWRERFYWIFILMGFLIPVVARFSPFFDAFSLSIFLENFSPSFEIFFLALGMAGGMAFSVAVGMALSVAFSVAFSVAVGIALGIAFSVAGGIAVGVAVGVAFGVIFGVMVGVAFGIALSVMVSVAFGVTFGVTFGVAGSVAYIVVFLRLPFYLFWELPRTFQLSNRASNNPRQAMTLWRKQPLHSDEVIQLPLFSLPHHLLVIAKQDTDACLDALADVGASLRQQWAVPQALNLILSDQLEQTITTALIVRFHEGTKWFPLGLFTEDEAQSIRELRSISQDTRGALDATTREAREQLLDKVIARIQALRLSLGKHEKASLRQYAEPLKQWKEVLESEAERISQEREIAGELPMRYEAGMVLERGVDGFKGRQDLFATLEGLLINQTQKITPLLLGQPRTGKSSVLKQLPVRLGRQVLPVYLDMERRANSNSSTSLFADLVSVIRQEALQHREAVSLPALDEELLAGDPYRVFENWIEEVEKALGNERWLLLALDEFNRIDDAVHNGRLDERIFFLLRSLIQHHPQVVLTLCGTFSLAECDPRWYEALKSVRYVPVSYFKPEEARRVLTCPAPDFPANMYSNAAIQRALTITGGQPFLIQLLGESIINDYNHSRRNLPPNSPKGLPLPTSVVENAIPSVLTGGDTFFMSLWQWLLKISNEPEPAADLLIALARQQPITNLGNPILREELLELFCERDLLIQKEEGTYCFQVPLVAMWIRKQRRLPRVVV